MIKPRGPVVAVQPYTSGTNEGGFQLLASEDKPILKGKVMAVGDKVPDLKVGDEVVYFPSMNAKVTVEEEEWILVDESDVIAVWESE